MSISAAAGSSRQRSSQHAVTRQPTDTLATTHSVWDQWWLRSGPARAHRCIEWCVVGARGHCISSKDLGSAVASRHRAAVKGNPGIPQPPATSDPEASTAIPPPHKDTHNCTPYPTLYPAPYPLSPIPHPQLARCRGPRDRLPDLFADTLQTPHHTHAQSTTHLKTAGMGTGPNRRRSGKQQQHIQKMAGSG